MSYGFVVRFALLFFFLPLLQAKTIRVATYNVALSQSSEGRLAALLRTGRFSEVRFSSNAAGGNRALAAAPAAHRAAAQGPGGRPGGLALTAVLCVHGRERSVLGDAPYFRDGFRALSRATSGS